MKKFDIVTKVNRTFHKAGFQLKKHSPEILVVTGVIGVVTSAVLACKATRKLDSVLEESKEQIDKIKDYIEEEGYSEEYTEKDAYRRDRRTLKWKKRIDIMWLPRKRFRKYF